MKENERISLGSETWLREDSHYITQRLLDRGFRYADQLMAMRIFDLLNIYMINAEIGQESILMLYRIFNHNRTMDESMELKLVGQTFPFGAWRKKHRDLSKVSVEDLVLAEDINRKAILRIYNSILKEFYRSGEYDGREYRYHDHSDVT
ncbi:MAG: hypothetical protein IK082_02950 [Oscillospiraceae bacterium]|nr:hypothetical protein [Oscillospiraceae bacterium]